MSKCFIVKKIELIVLSLLLCKALPLTDFQALLMFGFTKLSDSTEELLDPSFFFLFFKILFGALKYYFFRNALSYFFSILFKMYLFGINRFMISLAYFLYSI